MTAPHHPSHTQPSVGHAVAPRNGFGITALCLALVGLVFGLIPFTGIVAIILGLLATVFGLVGVGRVRRGLATNKKMTIFGTVLGLGALVLGIWGMTIVFRAVDDLSDRLQDSPLPAAAPAASAPADAAPAAVPLPATDSSVAAFGSAHTWESGVRVQVQAPKAFKPSSTAAGADGARAVSMVVQVHNGSQDPLALSMMSFTASFNGQEASEIYDSTKHLGGTPSSSVLPGKDATFTVAYSLPAGTGELQVEVRPEFMADKAFFTGQA
jgi:hypothetical protein